MITSVNNNKPQGNQSIEITHVCKFATIFIFDLIVIVSVCLTKLIILLKTFNVDLRVLTSRAPLENYCSISQELLGKKKKEPVTLRKKRHRNKALNFKFLST